MKKQLLTLLLAVTSSLNSQNLTWFKQFKNAGLTQFDNYSISTNAAGEIVTCGLLRPTNASTLQTIDFDPGTSVASLLGNPTKINTWVSKLDANGNYLWATKFDNDNNGSGTVLSKVNSIGEVITTAQFLGTTDFDSGAGTFTMATNTNANGFIAKLNSNGSFSWAKQFQQLSGAAGNVITDVEIDNLNNIFITGYFVGTIDFDPSPTATVSANGGSYPTTFFVKLDNSGNFLWLKTCISSGFSRPASMHLDKNKNIITAGKFGGTVDFDPSVSSNTLSSNQNWPYYEPYVMKLDSLGNFLWAKQFTDNIPFHNNTDCITGVVTDNFDNVYVCGQTNDSLDFDPGPAAYYLKAKAITDVYVVKLNSSGNFIWANMFGGDQADASTSIALDVNNDIYIGTSFKSSNIDFDPGVGTYSLSFYASPSMAVNRLTTNGVYVSTYYFQATTPDNTIIKSMVFNNSNELLLSGEFRIQTTNNSQWVDFDPGTGILKGYSGFGYQDVFIVKLGSLTTDVSQTQNPESNFVVYPNPSNGEIKIRFDSNNYSYVEIYDLEGKKIINQEIPAYKNEINFHLQTGIYFLKVVSPQGGVRTNKIIIR